MHLRGFARNRVAIALLSVGGILTIAPNMALGQLWSGAVSDDWLTAGNWQGGVLPPTSNPIFGTPNPIGINDANSAVLRGDSGISVAQASALSFAIGATANSYLRIESSGVLRTGIQSRIGGNSTLSGLPTGNSNGVGTVVVDGGLWEIIGASADTVRIGDLGTGTLTLSNGGTVRVGSGDSGTEGHLNLARQASSTGTLNIGAAGGQQATAAGILNAGSVRFGLGNARLVFNHTNVDAGYFFNAQLMCSQAGCNTSSARPAVEFLSGKTIIGRSTGLPSVGAPAFNGLWTVGAGATLAAGGDITLSGDFSVEDGGTLSSNGDMSGSPRSASTFRIAGDLYLDDGAAVQFGLGQFSEEEGASGVGDLIIVEGELRLGGSLYVADIGGFGNGVYRLFQYGQLSGDSAEMTVGDLPGDFSGAISVDGLNSQILLTVGAELGDIVYWIGGDGVWDMAASNWTDLNATISGPWNDAFAVFRVAAGVEAGTVSLTETVKFTGLQFMNNGFRIESDGGDLNATEALTTLRADAGVVGTIVANITGDGGVSKEGPGTVVLAGENSWVGNTIIQQGTLQIGDGGERGNLPGNVSNNGILAFNRSNTYLYGGAVSGTGGLSQIGVGTTILNGAQSYAGQTRVDAGTLQIGNGGTAGSLATNSSILINAAGTLALNRSDDITFANAVSGGGQLVQRGAGLLTLSGNMAGFTGKLLAENGMLRVTGAFGGTVDILDGGTLVGTGAVGTTRILSGGKLAAGNSIGTLTVNGNLTFEADSLFEVEVNPEGQSDLVRVNGQAILNGGSVLVIEAGEANAGLWDPLNTYTILTATGGIDGEFAEVTNTFAFLDAVLDYEAGSVTLQLERNDIDFSSVGTTSNQSAVGGAAQALGFAHTVADALVVLNESDAQAAFDSLSGEFHASVRGMLLDDSRLLRNAVMGRSYANAGRGLGTQLWMQALGHRGETEGDGVSKFERDAVGLLIGADHEMSNSAFSMGWAAGYHMNASADTHALRSEGDVNNIHIAAYGGMRQASGLGVRLGVGHTWHEVDAKRTVAFPGFEESLQSDYDGTTLQAFGEVDYRIAMGKAEVAPFLGLTWAQLDTDGFEEADFRTEIGSTAALRASSQSSDASFATLGARGVLPLGTASRLQGMLGYRRTLSGDDSTMEFSFLDGNQRFDVVGTPIARDALIADLGFDFALGENVRLGAAYNGQLASDARDHAIQARLVLTLE